MATVMTLMSVSGATAQPSSIYAAGSLFYAAPTDVIIVVSDFVDLTEDPRSDPRISDPVKVR